MASGPEEQSMRAVVIVPSFNHGQTLPGVLERVATLGLPVIVVDDGSTNDTATVMGDVRLPELDLTLLRHEKNRGKAVALHTGFRAAIERGFTHALTVDADGEHQVADMATLLAHAAAQPEALILAQRPGEPEDVGRSTGFNRLVGLSVHMQCGRRVRDHQCGLRVYPMRLVEKLPLRAHRYGFDVEVITRVVWAGGDVRLVDITGRRAIKPLSRFRRVRDTLLVTWVQVHLLLLALAPWHKRRWPADKPRVEKPSVWRTLMSWLNPMRAVRELVDDGVPAGEVGAAVAAGVFIANIPIYMLQSVMIFYVAGRWHLNPMIAFTASFISTPPLTLLLIAMYIVTGHVLLSGEWPDLGDYDLGGLSPGSVAGRTLVELLVGAGVIGTLLALVSFVLTVWLVRVVRRRHHRRAAASQAM